MSFSLPPLRFFFVLRSPRGRGGEKCKNHQSKAKPNDVSDNNSNDGTYRTIVYLPGTCAEDKARSFTTMQKERLTYDSEVVLRAILP